MTMLEEIKDTATREALSEGLKTCDDCNYTFEDDDTIYHCDSDDSDICEGCRPLHLEEGCHIE